jgi:hypothetical protein
MASSLILLNDYCSPQWTIFATFSDAKPEMRGSLQQLREVL